jgi:hypothetical protein
LIWSFELSFSNLVKGNVNCNSVEKALREWLKALSRAGDATSRGPVSYQYPYWCPNFETTVFVFSFYLVLSGHPTLIPGQ